MFGLYDQDGMLRYVGSDRDACLAYAELFDLNQVECLLTDLPESQPLVIRTKKDFPQEGSSN